MHADCRALKRNMKGSSLRFAFGISAAVSRLKTASTSRQKYGAQDDKNQLLVSSFSF
jgi:hypothetical protein